MCLADCGCSRNSPLGTTHWVVNNVNYGEDSDTEIQRSSFAEGGWHKILRHEILFLAIYNSGLSRISALYHAGIEQVS